MRNFYMVFSVSKKRLIIFLTSFVLVFFVFNIGVVLALSPAEGLDRTAGEGFAGNPTATSEELQNAGIVTSLPQAIGKFVGAGLSLLGVIFLTLMIYGGLSWMTARGNEQELTKAQGLIQAAVIGLIIVLMAYAVTAFLATTLATKA